MSNEKQSLIESLREAESQFHELMPVRDGYSKLFFRSLFWFALFSVLYTVVTGL
ncbi:hypothetical protein HAPAU_29370 [Halalkalicoccus paucihalophilus]|jgi:hypothetical protein|uniref:Uncharacterized protein n=1 Tax=Halalkalicoccus paucihalophilus TaxID=1008153 RepID=A0A151ABH2_9EURY|nr:hypothetical protein [Halalkalicoccus paucihalophilus]KYH24985.1 hypothetical protein HAPAU_29370 [Halalkalicoccus paucihalophilus]